MKVLFITNVFEKYINREPLGLMYLSSILKQHGHQVSLCGTELNRINEEFEFFKPDIVCYSITTGFHKFFLALNQQLKSKHKFISLFGGPHATFFPEIIQSPGVDIICLGEGEYAILDLASKLDKGESINAIPNLHVKSGDKIYQNPLRRLEENLDSFPHPDRELFYGKFKSARNAKIKSVITMRGCPFSCSYCFNKSYNQLYKDLGSVIRKRSVDDVILEINEMKSKYPLELVYFITDNFILDRNWIFEFAPKYKSKVNLPFHCLVSPDLIDGQIAEALRSAGCVSVMMGIECGNEAARINILKRTIPQEKIKNAAKFLRNAGIRICSQNILGIPGGSLDVDIDTYQLNLDLNLDYSVVSMMQPYPKTEIYNTAANLGLIGGNIDIIDDAYYDTSPFDIPEKDKVERLQKIFALGVGFKLPANLIRFLIGLPLDAFYIILYRIWKGYCGRFRIFPYKTSLQELLQSGINYVFGSGVR